MSDFNTVVNGIECVCRVVHYRPFVPASKDAPHMSSKFEFQLLDETKSLHYVSLETSVSDEDIERLQDEYEALVIAIKHGMDY